jgi:hypothetical protein
VTNWSKTIVFLYCLGSITSLAYIQVQTRFHIIQSLNFIQIYCLQAIRVRVIHMDIFVISKISQFFFQDVRRSCQIYTGEHDFPKLSKFFLFKKRQHLCACVCVCVCVCVCDTDCSAAAGLGLSYSSITDQCEGGRRYIVVFKFLLKEDINCE